MKINDLFKYSFVISVDDKRYQLYKKTFNYFKLPLSEKIGQKIKNQTAIQNCSYNHSMCIKLALERDYPFCLIFEDDAYPCTDIINEFDILLNKIDFEYDMIFIGWCVLSRLKKRKQHSFFKPHGSFCGSHAYIVNKKFYLNFLKNMKNNPKVTADQWRYFSNIYNIHYYYPCLFTQYNISYSIHGFKEFPLFNNYNNDIKHLFNTNGKKKSI